MKIILPHITLDNLDDAAGKIVAASENKQLWCFYGEMGAGKTTLIKAICKALQVSDNISSPTFSLVNEYRTAKGATLYHFDFYRIRSIEEVYDIGYEDYFYSGNTCLIEWPEKVDQLLNGEDTFDIHIKKDSEQSRTISTT